MGGWNQSQVCQLQCAFSENNLSDAAHQAHAQFVSKWVTFLSVSLLEFLMFFCSVADFGMNVQQVCVLFIVHAPKIGICPRHCSCSSLLQALEAARFTKLTFDGTDVQANHPLSIF
jgi:hypothetical protein